MRDNLGFMVLVLVSLCSAFVLGWGFGGEAKVVTAEPDYGPIDFVMNDLVNFATCMADEEVAAVAMSFGRPPGAVCSNISLMMTLWQANEGILILPEDIEAPGPESST